MNLKFWEAKPDLSLARSRLDAFLKKVDNEIRISECSHYFGYLGRDPPQDASIPEECLTCKYMLECRRKASLI